MPMNRCYFHILVTATMLWMPLLMGCSSMKTITLKMSATSDVNPNRQGQAAPLVVSMFQLKDDKAFKLNDFYALYYQPQETLGKDLLGIRQFELTPGVNKAWSWEISKETQFLGLVAAYRSMDASIWQLVVPVPKSFLGIKKPSIYFQFNRNAVNQVI